MTSEQAIEAINDHCQQVLEYEESHKDAGDNYSHMVAESWCYESDRNLSRQMQGPDVWTGASDAYGLREYGPAWSIDTMGLDADELADIALYIMQMEPGHIFSNMEAQWIVLDSYAIQEIEIPLDHLEVPHDVFSDVMESCEPYITGNGYAYMTTDAVWFAVVDPKELQAAIKERVAQ